MPARCRFVRPRQELVQQRVVRRKQRTEPAPQVGPPPQHAHHAAPRALQVGARRVRPAVVAES
eukprot:scaffold65754_cov90-Phaeocystis_antarctica.AAC.2